MQPIWLRFIVSAALLRKTLLSPELYIDSSKALP